MVWQDSLKIIVIQIPDWKTWFGESYIKTLDSNYLKCWQCRQWVKKNGFDCPDLITVLSDLYGNKWTQKSLWPGSLSLFFLGALFFLLCFANSAFNLVDRHAGVLDQQVLKWIHLRLREQRVLWWRKRSAIQSPHISVSVTISRASWIYFSPGRFTMTHPPSSNSISSSKVSSTSSKSSSAFPSRWDSNLPNIFVVSKHVWQINLNSWLNKVSNKIMWRKRVFTTLELIWAARPDFTVRNNNNIIMMMILFWVFFYYISLEIDYT